jgi:uncharacterized protein YjbJ (UPF0337 family)
MSELVLMPWEERRTLAAEPGFVSGLRARLTSAEFGAAVAYLLINVLDGVERPAAAWWTMREILTGMLSHAPDVAERLVNAGAQALIVPRGVDVLDAEMPEHAKRGLVGKKRDGLPPYMTVTAHEIMLVPEEYLLGEMPTARRGQLVPDGQSALVHEFGHLILSYGLPPENRERLVALFDANKRLSQDAWQALVAAKQADQDAKQAADAAQKATGDTKQQAEERANKATAHAKKAADVAREKAAKDVAWPNGRFINPDNPGRGVNYSATNFHEYWAELTAAFHGTNQGNDIRTQLPRNNGVDWVRRNVPEWLFKLLVKIYGPGDPIIGAHPFAETLRLNDEYRAFRAFWAQNDPSYVDDGWDEPGYLWADYVREFSQKPASGIPRKLKQSLSAAQLAGMTPEERAAKLASMPWEERKVLAGESTFVWRLRGSLPAAEFASVVSYLMIRVPAAVERAEPAQRELHAIMTRMLSHAPDIAERLINAGGKVVIVPRRNSRLGQGEASGGGEAKADSLWGDHRRCDVRDSRGAPSGGIVRGQTQRGS